MAQHTQTHDIDDEILVQSTIWGPVITFNMDCSSLSYTSSQSTPTQKKQAKHSGNEDKNDIVIPVYRVGTLGTNAYRRQQLFPPSGVPIYQMDEWHRANIIQSWKNIFPLLCVPADELPFRFEEQLQYLWERYPESKFGIPSLPAWMSTLQQCHVFLWNKQKTSSSCNSSQVDVGGPDRESSFVRFWHRNVVASIRVPPSLVSSLSDNKNSRSSYRRTYQLQNWLSLFQFTPFIPFVGDWMMFSLPSTKSGSSLSWTSWQHVHTMATYWLTFIHDRLHHLFQYQCTRKSTVSSKGDSSNVADNVVQYCWVGPVEPSETPSNGEPLIKQQFRNVMTTFWQHHVTTPNVPSRKSDSKPEHHQDPLKNGNVKDPPDKKNTDHTRRHFAFWRYYWRQAPPTRLWRFMQLLKYITPDTSLRGVTIQLSLPYDKDDLTYYSSITQENVSKETIDRYQIMASIPPERSDIVSIYCEDTMGTDTHGNKRPCLLIARLFLQDISTQCMHDEDPSKSGRYIPQQRARLTTVDAWNSSIPSVPASMQVVVAWRTQQITMETFLDYYIAVSTLFTVSELPCNCAFGDPRVLLNLCELKTFYVSSKSGGLTEDILPWNYNRGLPPLCECRCGHGIASVLSYHSFWKILYNTDMYRSEARRWIYACLMTLARDVRGWNEWVDDDIQWAMHWYYSSSKPSKSLLSPLRPSRQTSACSSSARTIPPNCAIPPKNTAFFTHETNAPVAIDCIPDFPSCRRMQRQERQLKLFLYMFVERLIMWTQSQHRFSGINQFFRYASASSSMSMSATKWAHGNRSIADESNPIFCPREEGERYRKLRKTLNGILCDLPVWLTQDISTLSRRQCTRLIQFLILMFSWDASELVSLSESTVFLWWKQSLEFYAGIMEGLYQETPVKRHPVVHLSSVFSSSPLYEEGILHPNMFHHARRLLSLFVEEDDHNATLCQDSDEGVQNHPTQNPNEFENIVYNAVYGKKTLDYPTLVAWIVGIPSGFECPYAIYCGQMRMWCTLMEFIHLISVSYSSIESYVYSQCRTQKAPTKTKSKASSTSSKKENPYKEIFTSRTMHEKANIWLAQTRIQYQEYGWPLRRAWIQGITSNLYTDVKGTRSRNDTMPCIHFQAMMKQLPAKQTKRLQHTGSGDQKINWKDLVLKMIKSSVNARFVLLNGKGTKGTKGSLPSLTQFLQQEKKQSMSTTTTATNTTMSTNNMTMGDGIEDDNLWERIWQHIHTRLYQHTFRPFKIVSSSGQQPIYSSSKAIKSSEKLAKRSKHEVDGLSPIPMVCWCMTVTCRHILYEWSKYQLSQSSHHDIAPQLRESLHDLANRRYTQIRDDFYKFLQLEKDDNGASITEYPSRIFIHHHWDILAPMVEWLLMSDIVLYKDIFRPLCQSMDILFLRMSSSSSSSSAAIAPLWLSSSNRDTFSGSRDDPMRVSVHNTLPSPESVLGPSDINDQYGNRSISTVTPSPPASSPSASRKKRIRRSPSSSSSSSKSPKKQKQPPKKPNAYQRIHGCLNNARRQKRQTERNRFRLQK